jgi:DUF4097 and DUF4098 domain-containing protein YvlB
MRAGILTRGVLPLLAVAVMGGRAAAQQDDDQEWVRNCRDHGWGSGSRHCEVRVSNMAAPGGTLTIDGGGNGGVSVQGWDGQGVRVTSRVQVSGTSDADARELASQVRVQASGSTIRAEGPRATGRHRGWSVSYVVMVPRRSDLSVQTSNGGIAIREVSGRMELSAMNGPLSLSSVGGTVRGRTVNGPVRVRLTGTRWQGTGLDVETTNGPVVMTVPESFAAHLDVSNTNGPMSLGFPVTVTGRVGHRIETDLNGGGATIRARTVNGPITLDRDGR